MQRLAGSAAAVSRFISRLGEKAMPLYRLLKKSDTFEWTDEADARLAAAQGCINVCPNLGSSSIVGTNATLHRGN